ncbi:hypothetical protein [Gluconobacter morbifer]|nr:hypothetical protein [Gluconobacter morbifer]
MQDEQQVTDEDKLRQALSRLGAGNARSAKPRSSTPTTERRRRFVRDGQVVVEHQGGRGLVTRNAGQEDQEEIERLRQSVKREQRRWEEAERHLSDMRGQIRVFETREAHAKIRISELTKDLREHQDTIQTLKGELHRVRDQAQEASRRSPRPVGRPRKEQPPVEAEEMPSAVQPEPRAANEPEPVQWWIKA